jgi:hypothetical protein
MFPCASSTRCFVAEAARTRNTKNDGSAHLFHPYHSCCPVYAPVPFISCYRGELTGDVVAI